MSEKFQEHNIRLTIEYDGSDYCGWQKQLNKPSIQGTLEDLIEKLFGERRAVYGAGRTDSGVHAKAQVANFKGDDRYSQEKWVRLFNAKLPRSIRITDVKFVTESFHSQKWATGKVYEFRILNRKCHSALDKRVFFYPMPLDLKAMRNALTHFIGEHDFEVFQGAKATVKTTVRKVQRFELTEEPGDILRFEIEANGFLKQMVRSIMGTVLKVGEGKLDASEIPEIIRTKNKRRLGRTLSPEGLTLVKVKY